MNLILRRVLQGGAVAGLLFGGDLAFHSVRAHGSHGGGGGEQLQPGEFKLSPVITLEGHGGFEDNLEDRPQHYAIDGMFGMVMEWGLENEGSFSIEASFGPAFVWGESEHFYGAVHVDDHSEEGHDDHSEEGHDDHDDHAEEDHDDHAEEDHDDHDDHAEEDHDDHAGHDHSGGTKWKQTDIKGFIQARYQPNDRLSISAKWMPYFEIGSAEENVGMKNEVGATVVYAFGDGDVNFALGDGLESVVDGIFVSVENRTGWDTQGTYLGNYTDTWLGFGFFVDQLNVTLTAGPRFYSPGDYSGLSQRTDWGGEIGMEYPLAESVVLFAHWKPIYSTAGGEGWGKGWSHHVGTGVSFSF